MSDPAALAAVPPLQVALDAAEAALTDVISAALASPSKARFAQVVRVAGLAQALGRERIAMEVADVEPLVEDGIYQVPAGLMQNMPLRIGGGNLDNAGLMREMMMALMPALDAQKADKVASTRASQAQELGALLELVPRLDGDEAAGMNARIAALKSEILGDWKPPVGATQGDDNA